MLTGRMRAMYLFDGPAAEDGTVNRYLFTCAAREAGEPFWEAIAESVRSRIRPIYMSSITTVCAMAPLVLSPGAGSEFYRGLGSVVIGGILVSTIFTIFLIPALLSLTLDTVTGIKRILNIGEKDT